MCGRSMYCNTCRLALVIRLCRVTSSLLPWLCSHDLSSATVQRSSGAAAMVYLQEKQFAAQRCCVNLKRERQSGSGSLRLPFLLLQACWLAGEEHRRRCARIKPPMNRYPLATLAITPSENGARQTRTSSAYTP